ncbi:MAG: hypothetical protein VX899_01770 [Myxococcota bacterium]|nr:hypothetical protein [Myxococcota bacterium]
MWLALVAMASAVEVTLPPTDPGTRALLSVGGEPLATASAGVLHTRSLPSRPLSLGATLTVPVFLLEGADHRLELSARTPIARGERFFVDGRVAAREQHLSGTLIAGETLSLHAQAIAGARWERGFVALELGGSANLVSQLRPQEAWVRDHPDASAAWYGPSGGLASVAVQGARRVSDGVELSARAGLDTPWRGGSRTAPMFFGVGCTLWL